MADDCDAKIAVNSESKLLQCYEAEGCLWIM